ncbi:MAG: hypothetical protein LBK06_01140 [Planctomycetaceae bacterium]|jgi:hypothetical protein|nr:hypothetical protein [Planctomycetaceae bacterium]
MSIIDRINNFQLEQVPVLPEITISLDGRGSRLYNVGDTLAGSYWFDSVGGDEIQAVEVSVIWHTEGKGNEDLGVHAFWRFSIENGDWIDPRRPGRFSTILPRSPLSYSGILIKISWLVRVRLFLADGRETVEEVIFHLGNLPDVRTLKPTDP